MVENSVNNVKKVENPLATRNLEQTPLSISISTT